MRNHQFTRRRVLQLAGAAGVAAPFVRMGSAAAQNLRTVKIVTTSGNLTWEEVLKQNKYMEQLGIQAETLHVADATKIIGALVSGEADIAIATGFSNLFPAMEKGAKLKLLAGGIILGQQTVFTGKPEIKTIKDLAGKTIGVGSLGAQLHQIMVALLLKHGVDPNGVQWANVGSSTDVFKAVVAGKVDAGPSPIDVIPQLAQYGVRQLQDGNFWEQLPEYAFQGSYASSDAIANKRDLLVRTLAGYCKLYRYISGPDSKDAFIRARQIALGKTGPAADAEALYQWQFFQKYQVFATNLALTPKQLQYQQELNVRLGIQKTVLPNDQVADMSLAQDAVKLIS
jgi:ABC-type nitrate/sulfonate/bicarbonate transport system substrate-binding protein